MRLLYIGSDAESIARVEELLTARKDVLLLNASDVNLGIRLARTQRPEVILVDVDMPAAGSSGAGDHLKLLRADLATQAAPILAISATATPESISKSLEAGYFLCLAKPLKADPFTQALDYALEFAAVERAEQ